MSVRIRRGAVLAAAAALAATPLTATAATAAGDHVSAHRVVHAPAAGHARAEPTRQLIPTRTVAPIESTVTMVSEKGDFVGQGASRLWRSPVDAITTGGSASTLGVSMSGASGDFTLDFAAPQGQTLVPGSYVGAQRFPFESAGRPGIDVNGDSRGCNEVSGAFWVLDLSPDRSRVWIVYEASCGDGRQAAAFGEVRIGEPGEDGVQVTPSRVHWPANYPHVAVRPVPVHVRNTGSATLLVQRASIVAGAASFRVLDNTCHSVAVGDDCSIYVGFTPSIRGDRLGELKIDTSTGTEWVPLSGHGTGGLTSWQMSSDAGDFIGQGAHYAYTPQTGAQISASGTESVIHASVSSGEDSWSADVQAPPGFLLLPGTTFATTRFPFNSGGGLDVSGDGRGCNQSDGTATVNTATYGDDGHVQSFSIDFVQHCEHGTPALRGTIAWKAPDPHQPPRDHVAPHAVTRLTHHWSAGHRLQLSWRNPRDADWADTRITVLPGRATPARAADGREVYTGRGTSTAVTLRRSESRTCTLGVWTRDTSGNARLVTLVVHPH